MLDFVAAGFASSSAEQAARDSIATAASRVAAGFTIAPYVALFQVRQVRHTDGCCRTSALRHRSGLLSGLLWDWVEPGGDAGQGRDGARRTGGCGCLKQ